MRLTRKQAKEMGLDIKTKPEDRGLDAKKSKRKNPVKAEQYPQSQRLFDAICASHGLPKPVPEYPFAEAMGRKWRFDWLFEGWLALEKQGAIWTGGRHVQPAALVKEYEKLNYAVLLGFSVMFATPEQIEDGSIFPLVKRALEGREEQT